MSEPFAFSIDGTNFKLAPLKLRSALRAEAILAEAVIPAFVALAGGIRDLEPAALGRVLGGLEKLPELVDLFAASCQVDRAPRKVDGSIAGEQWVSLATFVDTIFERRNAAVLAWLVACVEYQFADFFDGTGVDLLAPAASRFVSILAPASTGGSGES